MLTCVLLFQLIFVLPVLCTTPAATYMCGACTLLINELEYKIANVKTGEKIQVGSFRIDEKGNQQGANKIPYARSEIYIHEILEDICFRSRDYVLVVNPTTGKGVYVSRLSTHLKGNESTVIQSKLQNACSDFLDEHEDELVNFLKKEHEDPMKEFCHLQLKICTAVDVIPLPPKPAEAQEDGTETGSETQAEDKKTNENNELDDEL